MYPRSQAKGAQSSLIGGGSTHPRSPQGAGVGGRGGGRLPGERKGETEGGEEVAGAEEGEGR